MSSKPETSANPFAGFVSDEDDTTSPGARRAAFRQDPHGTLVLGGRSQCQIARNQQTVRKSGLRVRAEEGRALQFAHSLQLPVPAVSEINVSGQHTEIVMDFVEGECLEEAWPSMDSTQKRSVAEQIRQIITRMRQASSDQRKIGAFEGPARDCRQIKDYSGGPFDTEAQFNTFVLDLLRGTPSLIRSTLAESLGTENRIVLAHGDLSPRNIIVQGDRVQALIDWEFAGWYPEYWEYVKFFDRPTGCKDWKEYADVIFDTKYPKELLVYQTLARWQRP